MFKKFSDKALGFIIFFLFSWSAFRDVFKTLHSKYISDFLIIK